MKKHFLFASLLSIFLFISCEQEHLITVAKKDKKLIEYVNPFIGTGGHGHTYPGASLPFGMMQLSPDTRLDGWDGCSGYHYSDKYIYGFSHTHLSGTGVSDYGDILLMPTNKIIFNNGADGKEGYKSKFSHKKEVAKPGFYEVHLDDTDIDVKLTVSERSGVHKYQFKKGEKQIVILDLEHRDEVLDAKITINSKTNISGYRHSKAWATDQRLFFDMHFSRPYTKVTFLNDKTSGKKVKAAFEFDETKEDSLEIIVGISPVDEKGAMNNWEKEIGEQTFQQVKETAQNIWEKQLEKIVIESDNTAYKTNFYTAMYHTMIAPNLYQDIDGRYRDMDLKIHQSDDHKHYTVFSL